MEITAVTLREADERFRLRSLFGLDRDDDDEEVVVSGDVTLENLPLDFTELDTWSGLTATNSFSGLVVDGDLTVTDWITNWEMDFGPFLLVRGDVRAKNFGTSGSEVLVEGNLEVAQTLAGIYNHGRTVIKGDTRAEVVLTEQHAFEFHGRLNAEIGIAGNFLQVADPAKVQVGSWAGHVLDLRHQILPNLGSRSMRALRGLDSDFWDYDRRQVLSAMEAGRSLLRASGPRQVGRETPLSFEETIREVLRQARYQEQDRWDDGFYTCTRESEEPFVEVWFSEADEPAEADEPKAPEELDPATELRGYAEALIAAGYRATIDPDDDECLQVRR
ncbi:hypothetical protein ACFU9X_02480 [Streptomyces atratus]|uniref:hypothetical protein n=1 Tax=Streptomyces atratus TaxID=1893 RepID=UPI0036A8824E